MFHIANKGLKENWKFTSVYLTSIIAPTSAAYYLPGGFVSPVLKLFALFIFTNWATFASEQMKSGNSETEKSLKILFQKNSRFLRIITLLILIGAVISIVSIPISAYVLNVVGVVGLFMLFDDSPAFAASIAIIGAPLILYLQVIIIISVSYLIYHNKGVLESFTESTKLVKRHLHVIPLILVFSVAIACIMYWRVAAYFPLCPVLFAIFYSYLSVVIMSGIHINARSRTTPVLWQ